MKHTYIYIYLQEIKIDNWFILQYHFTNNKVFLILILFKI